MRLTERPRTLSEMRPGIAWPADVQAALDKALERDVARRYSTASEFGRDLQRAIERMPEALAAELGTQMMDMPATRVHGPDEGASPSPVMQAAAPGRKMFNVAIAGSLAAVLAVAAVVVKIISGSPETPTVGADTLTKTPPVTTNPAPTSGTPSQAGTSKVPVDSQDPPPITGGSKTPNTGAAAKSVVVQLQDLLNNESSDHQKVPSVLERLGKLETQVTTNEERYLVARVRSNAFAAKETKADTLEACALLRKIPPQVVGEHKSSVDGKIYALSCP